jgi:hypothetical protein
MGVVVDYQKELSGEIEKEVGGMGPLNKEHGERQERGFEAKLQQSGLYILVQSQDASKGGNHKARQQFVHKNLLSLPASCKSNIGSTYTTKGFHLH